MGSNLCARLNALLVSSGKSEEFLSKGPCISILQWAPQRTELVLMVKDPRRKKK